jgi:FkbM family methyltransferase
VDKPRGDIVPHRKSLAQYRKEVGMSIGNSLRGLRAILIFDNWPSLVLGRLFDRRTGLKVYRKNGMEILIDHLGGDCNGTRACLTTDMYSRYLPHLGIRRPVRVLDLGANGGGFLLMLKLAGVEVDRGVCVEMNPQIFQRLQYNMTRNLGPAVTAVNAAVCSMPLDSEVLLKPSRGGTGEGLTGLKADAEGPHVAVRTTTMPALLDRYFNGEAVDLCKIDVEGAEYEILDSSPDDTLRRIGFLLIEFHHAPRTPAVVDRLRRLGFSELASDADHKTSDSTEVRFFRGPQAEAASALGRSAA